MGEHRSVNLILTTGKGKDVEYLMQGREVDKSDLYGSRPDLFQPGKYCFYWPGACSFFGGGIREGESPEEAFKREVEQR